jgi:hypothetical protein
MDRLIKESLHQQQSRVIVTDIDFEDYKESEGENNSSELRDVHKIINSKTMDGSGPFVSKGRDHKNLGRAG